MITNPFRDRHLRDWLCQDVDLDAIGFNSVATTGSGPYAEAEFDEFLGSLGIQPRSIRSNASVLVVGRRDWSESALRALLQARSGKKLRVYSQEMFEAFLVKGIDPLTAPDEVVERFGRGHPALTFLSEVGFDWPTTMVYGGGGSELPTDLLKLGFLRYLGYQVGVSGGIEEDRRDLLRQAYNARRLPAVFPREYREEWGARAPRCA
jgi:hypothetical protein